MRGLLLLVSAAMGIAIAAGDAHAWPAPENSKLCTIGGSGSYIARDAECIDTRAKCEKKGGSWRGSVSGRGRSVGCDLPTKDNGKTCSDSSQCETICVAHDSSNRNCSCYDRTIVPKGLRPDTCSFGGLRRGANVD